MYRIYLCGGRHYKFSAVLTDLPGECDMYYKLYKTIFALYMIYICIFMSIEVSAQKPEHSLPHGQKRTVSVSETGGNVDFQNVESGDFWQRKAGTNADSGRRLKAGFVKTSVLFCLISFLSSVFFLWAFLKKSYIAYLQSCFYPLARFLCDLLIQQKKDGKRRAAFI